MNEYIQLAIEEAQKALLLDEVPVGAIIVYQGKVVAKAHNLKKSTKNVFSHAEMLAIEEATQKIGDWRLNEAEMYVTLEPCPMCASAIQQSRIKKVFIGSHTLSQNNSQIIDLIFNSSDNNPQVQYEHLNIEECSNLLTNFFDKKRHKN